MRDPFHPEAHQKVPLSEKLKTIPSFFGVHLEEKPVYNVLHKEGHLEIRAYEPMTLARITLDTDYYAFRESAFLALADYIFGRNEAEEEISMTTPVFKRETGSGWTMAFMLPSEFNADLAPKPRDSAIQIIDQSAKTFATLSYHGNNTPEKMAAKLVELSHWLELHKTYHVLSNPPLYAQYNGLFTIPFMKLNEVQVEVQALD
ncbi:MAG: heme-binding protein [Bdellovibrionales bacterium]|nr:heme-binding protein [Bdellovibrionales bacterium]